MTVLSSGLRVNEIASFSGAKAGQECQQPPCDTGGSSAVTQTAVGTESRGRSAWLPCDVGRGSYVNMAPRLSVCQEQSSLPLTHGPEFLAGTYETVRANLSACKWGESKPFTALDNRSKSKKRKFFSLAPPMALVLS